VKNRGLFVALIGKLYVFDFILLSSYTSRPLGLHSIDIDKGPMFSILHHTIKKICLAIMVSGAVCMVQQPLQSAQLQPQCRPVENNLFIEQPVKKISFLIFIVSLALLRDVDYKNPRAQIEFKKLFTNTMVSYIHVLTTTLAHEFGHAIAAWGCFGAPLDIHFGGEIGDDRSLFTIGPITIHGLISDKAQAYYYQTNDVVKRNIVLLAGGACGIIWHYIFKTFECYYKNLADAKVNGKNDGALRLLVCSCKQAITTLSFEDCIALDEFFQMIIPVNHGCDASAFWQNCGVPERNMSTIEKGGVVLSALCLIGLLRHEFMKFKKARNAQHTQGADSLGSNTTVPVGQP
jgi:hypothetical protein